MTTNSNVEIFWIDDDDTRRIDAQHLEKVKEDLKVTFLIYGEWVAFIEEMKERPPIDLFLLDYLLFVKRLNPGGLGVAGEIRENFPDCPIYIFSVKSIPEIAQQIADSILDFKVIQREPVLIYLDAVDYRAIRMSPRSSNADLLGFLKAPEIDQERIILATPESIKRSVSSQSPFSSIEFAKWTKDIFLRLPGFVYDELFSATMLGMSAQTFHKMSSIFEKAKYCGVFSSTQVKLWWVSTLKAIVFELANKEMPDDSSTDLSRLTPRLFKLDESEVSKCFVCGERYPETVGSDHNGENYHPVHYRCSIPHPKKTRMVFFEEERQY